MLNVTRFSMIPTVPGPKNNQTSNVAQPIQQGLQQFVNSTLVFSGSYPASALRVQFQGTNSTQQAKQAKRIIAQLENLRTKSQLDDKDQLVLEAYSDFFNRIRAAFVTVEHAEVEYKVDALSVGSLNKVSVQVKDKVLVGLQKALNARVGATQYKPRTVTVSGKDYIVHNNFVQLKPNYSSRDIKDILRLLEKKNVFKVHTHPTTGLIRTSETSNEDMLRQWFTDSSMNGLLQREKDPKNWKKNLVVSAAALNIPEAKEAIEKAVQNPDWYRNGGIMDGVFHIYLPQSVRFDPDTQAPVVEEIRLDESWFNQKRIESKA